MLDAHVSRSLRVGDKINNNIFNNNNNGNKKRVVFDLKRN